MISEILLENVKKFEGCRLAAYKDAVGVWTIGYGHTRGVHPGDRITQWYADDLLAEDLKIAEKQVLQLGLFPEEGEDPSRYPCTTQGQLDALTDFVFNLGIGRLKASTLLKKIRQGAPDAEIAAEFKKWQYGKVKGQLVILPGLVKRRHWEAERFFE